MKDLMSRMAVQENYDGKQFALSDTLFQPAYSWIWNAPLDEREIARQLDQMRAAGIRTMYILPEPRAFRPHTMRTSMEPEYLTDDFFHMVRFAAEHALKLGINIWLYDEGGWPSGGACGQVVAAHPELCRKTVASREIRIERGEPYVPGERAIAAFIREGADKPRYVPAGEALDQGAVMTEYYAKWLDGTATDSLDEDIGNTFVAGTHELYTKFLGDLFGERNADGTWVDGSGQIQMMFTDEPGAGRLAWPRNFEKIFRERFGYDIARHIPALLESDQDADEEGTRARIDYHMLTGEMFRDHYFVPIHEWCRRNHLLSTGHIDLDHRSDGCLFHCYGSVLPLLRELDVPGIDVIWQQIDGFHFVRPEKSAPSADLRACEEGNGFFPRFAASAAAQTGGKYAVSESLAVYGAGISGDEMRFVLHYQLVRGINLFNYMTMSYSKQGALPLVMRPNFISEMPGYENLRALNDYTARACYLMQLGRSGADTALYFPARDIWSGGSACSRAVEAFDELGQRLEARQVDFDIIDDEGLRMAQRAGDELRLGLARYRHVLVPKGVRLPEETARALEGISSEVSPALACDHAALRVRSRILPDGSTLWMLFNESPDTQVFRVSLPQKGRLYLLDPERARATEASPSETLAFYPGEARFYMDAAHALDGAGRPCCGESIVLSISDFTLLKTRETYITPGGVHVREHSQAGVPCELGSWAGLFGGEYSGEGRYSARAALAAVPERGETYVLDLGRVECTARVRVNGQLVGIAWAHPMRVVFDGEVFANRRDFTLDIDVAGTLANQCASHPLAEYFEAADLGPYQPRLNEFEKRAPKGGLYGPVTLLKYQ